MLLGKISRHRSRSKFLAICIAICGLINSRCRCTRDFEKSEALTRKDAVIKFQPTSPEFANKIEMTSIAGGTLLPPAKLSRTVFTTLEHNIAASPTNSGNATVYTKAFSLKRKNLPDLQVLVHYTTRLALVSPNLAGTTEYRITSIECTDGKKIVYENSDWLTSLTLDKEPDAKIFL